jgi:hypothetical protein
VVPHLKSSRGREKVERR